MNALGLTLANPMIARVSIVKSNFFLDFWTNPGPGLLPLGSDCGIVNLAGAVASVASLAVFLASECIL